MNQTGLHAFNLLPYRENARKKFYWYVAVLFAFCALVAKLCLIPIEFVVRAATHVQRIHNDRTLAANTGLLNDLVNLSHWKTKKHAQRTLLHNINNLANSAIKVNQNHNIVHFLAQLRENLTAGIIVEQILQYDNHVRLVGRAISHHAMTRFMRCLSVPGMHISMPFFELKQHAAAVSFVVEVQLYA